MKRSFPLAVAAFTSRSHSSRFSYTEPKRPDIPESRVAKVSAPALSFAQNPEYANIRASYRPTMEKLKIAPDAFVVDLASGPGGKIARELVDMGISVFCIDPVGMDTEEAKEQYIRVIENYASGNPMRGKVQAAKGFAHAMPILDASVDILISGDAGHWFKYSEDVKKEINRVVKPEGKVVLIWRQLDSKDQFTQNLDEYLATRDEYYKGSRGRFVMNASREPENIAKKFVNEEEWEVSRNHTMRYMTVDQVEALLRTWGSLQVFFEDASESKLKTFREFLESETHSQEKGIRTKWVEEIFVGKPKQVQEKSMSYSDLVGRKANNAVSFPPSNGNDPIQKGR